MLDVAKLPEATVHLKGCWHHGGLKFGTVYLPGRQAHVTDPRWRFSDANPDVTIHLLNPGTFPFKSEPIVAESIAYTDNTDTAMFYTVELRMQHNLQAMRRSHYAVRRETAYLLSSYLQTGEGMRLSDLARYQHRDGLNFLPFLIDETHFHFFVHCASEERTEAAARTFVHVLDKIKDIPFDALLRRLEAILLMERALMVDREVGSALTDMVDVRRLQFLWEVVSYRACLGFVYQDLPGSQSATRFSYDMLEKKEGR